MNLPFHHLLVERADWGAIFQERRRGATWQSLCTRQGLGALGRAVVEGSAGVVQQLLEMGAVPRASRLSDGSLFSPLWEAIERQQDEIAVILIQAGADVEEAREGEEGLPIDKASACGMGKTTRALVAAGANPEGAGRSPSPLEQWMEALAHAIGREGEEGDEAWREAGDTVAALVDAGAEAREDWDAWWGRMEKASAGARARTEDLLTLKSRVLRRLLQDTSDGTSQQRKRL